MENIFHLSPLEQNVLGEFYLADKAAMGIVWIGLF